MRWLRLFTPVTELSLLLGIHSLAALLGLRLAHSGPAQALFKTPERFVPQRESFSGKRLYGLPSGGPFANKDK